MNQKTIASVLLLVAAALGGPVAVDQARDIQNEVIQSVTIDGPEEAVVGELVELHVTGTRPSWLPPTDDAYVKDDLCILSFRAPGEYEVVASSVAGRSTRVVKHIVTVGSPEPTPAPTPAPGPAPDDVVPTPEPDDHSVLEITLTRDVAQWCAEANADRAVCRQLGDNFIYAATNSSSVDELLQKVAQRNRRVNQRTVAPVLGKIQQHLYDNLAGKDFTAHQCAFDEIGQGFLQYAGEDGPGTGEPILWHGM